MTLDWTIETLWQIALLGGLAILIPFAFYKLHPPRQRWLVANLLVSAALVYVVAVLLFMYLYSREGVVVLPAPRLSSFAILAGKSTLIWLPVLLLTGLGLGQKVEARKSKIRESQEAGDQ